MQSRHVNLRIRDAQSAASFKACLAGLFHKFECAGRGLHAAHAAIGSDCCCCMSSQGELQDLLILDARRALGMCTAHHRQRKVQYPALCVADDVQCTYQVRVERPGSTDLVVHRATTCNSNNLSRLRRVPRAIRVRRTQICGTTCQEHLDCETADYSAIVKIRQFIKVH